MTEAEAVSTPYLIAHFQARKPYRIKGFCSTLRTPDDFGGGFRNRAELRRADLESGSSHIRQ